MKSVKVKKNKSVKVKKNKSVKVKKKSVKIKKIQNSQVEKSIKSVVLCPSIPPTAMAYSQKVQPFEEYVGKSPAFPLEKFVEIPLASPWEKDGGTHTVQPLLLESHDVDAKDSVLRFLLKEQYKVIIAANKFITEQADELNECKIQLDECKIQLSAKNEELAAKDKKLAEVIVHLVNAQKQMIEESGNQIIVLKSEIAEQSNQNARLLQINADLEKSMTDLALSHNMK